MATETREPIDKLLTPEGKDLWRWWGRRFAPEYYVNRKFTAGRLVVKLSCRSSKGMGRFGGGWQWKMGFQLGGGTLLISLLVAELSISILKKSMPTPEPHP